MGFFAVLAASLFAVFLFTVFGGYSLLLWCQQSLLMVVPPAVVLAVLVWTFLKMDDKITACKSGWRNWKPHRKTSKSPRNKYSDALQKRLSCRGVALLHLTFIRWVIQPFKHHHAQVCKACSQRKTDCSQRHTEQNAHSNTEQDTRDLTFLHFTAPPFRTMQQTAATREHTASEPPPQYPAAPATRCSAEEGFSQYRPRLRPRKSPSGPRAHQL